jgi:hypothetical protein
LQRYKKRNVIKQRSNFFFFAMDENAIFACSKENFIEFSKKRLYAKKKKYTADRRYRRNGI